jgi:sugar-specific transcriptional regulator TrmB
MDTTILKNLGFTDVEIGVYIDLVQKGESSAAELAKRVRISRTYVYDALEHLLQKGVISYVLKNNRKRFKVLDLKKLLEFVENKRKFFEKQGEQVSSFVEELKKQSIIESKSPKVEVLEGSEGLKTILNDIVRTGKDAVGWGATDRIKKFVPDFFIEKYLRERDKKRIKVKQLTAEGKAVLKSKHSLFKHLSKEFSSPVTFGKYGNNVIIFFWSDIPVVIRVQNEDIAKSFQKHFEMLWKIAHK